MKRIAVYAYHDEDGVVDGYVYYYLKELQNFCSKIIVVVNGELKQQYQEKLTSMGMELYIRESAGFDAFAYKYGIEKITDISQYDELIISNNSFFGPVFPLSEMFESMESHIDNTNNQKYDFWGCSIHPQTPEKIDKSQEFDYINEHIQSYFVVFSKTVLKSDKFMHFWNNLKISKSLVESFCLFELRLTSFFASCGYAYGSYVNHKCYGDVNALILYPYEALVQSRCPFIKREIFSENYQNVFSIGEGEQTRKALNFLDNCNYDKSLIWQHLLRTIKMSELRMHLQLNYTFSSEYSSTENISRFESKKVALILYVYYEEAIWECLNYVKNLPSSCHLFLVASKDSVYEKLQNIFVKHNTDKEFYQAFNLNKFKNIHFVKKQNKGRDLTAYLIDCKQVFDDFDYVCFFHDKKSPHLGSSLKTKAFFEHCMNALLPSENFIYNAIAKFEEDPNLGLLVPPPLHYGSFYPVEYFMHPNNKEWMLMLIDELKLNVPFDEFPVAPYGDMFWVRGKAMKPLFKKDWSYDTDIPSEPIDTDGTILHAIERIIPFIAQSAGYYTSWLCSEDTARKEINNLYYINKSINIEFFKKNGCCNHDKLISLLSKVNYDEKTTVVCDNSNIRHFDSYELIELKRNIKKLYRKKIKYQVLNVITFGLISKFRKRIRLIKQKMRDL